MKTLEAIVNKILTYTSQKLIPHQKMPSRKLIVKIDHNSRLKILQNGRPEFK